MQVLVVGGAGHVGTILRPALEAEHDVRYLDMRRVEDTDAPTFVGSVTDVALVREAAQGVDAVVYLAMGLSRPAAGGERDYSPMFDVNVHGVYRVLHEALSAGARNFIFASSLSVFEPLDGREGALNEQGRPDSWIPYGLTKWLGEQVCERAADLHPQATISVLRLYLPVSDASECRWPGDKQRPFDPDTGQRKWGCKTYPLGPRDTQRLFLAALALDRPGLHVMHAAGDLENKHVPYQQAEAILGWTPRNE